MQIREKKHCNINKNTVAQCKEACYAIFSRSTGKLLGLVNSHLLTGIKHYSHAYPEWLQEVHKYKRPTCSPTSRSWQLFARGEKTLTVFFYINHTFDKVWKKGPLLKLLHMGVCYNMYRWICHYESTGSHWIVTLHFKYHLKGTKHCFPKKTTTVYNV